ncbi:MAG: 1-phosphofructokinase family hexose kinase [Anaerolineales bacterium]|nr:1-phosphofructokinase family hexose kinase [Anaerolineales bacterium]
MTRIFTLTLNPSLDRTYEISSLQPGTYHRGRITSRDPGGKGINVSRNLQQLGVSSTICGFFGGRTGEAMVSELTRLGFHLLPVWVEEETRSNLTVLEADSLRMTKLNETGPQVSELEAEKMLELVTANTQPGDRWVFSGSLPPGLPTDYYAHLIRTVRSEGGISYLDTSGAPLAEALETKPDVLRINMEEAGQVIETKLESETDVISALAKLKSSGIHRAIISGGREGAWLGSEEGWFQAGAPHVQVRNTVGAGDAMLSALIWAELEITPPEEILPLGVAAGSASCELEGTAVVERSRVLELVKNIKVRRGNW